MGKNLGAKSRVIDADARDRILELYDAFDEADPDPDYSKVFATTDFGYWTITVERPLLGEDGEPVVGSCRESTKIDNSMSLSRSRR
jgi:type I restriction enzyme M protein